jgi:hypothetical protein
MENITIPAPVIAELERRTLIFVPGISRAASAGIGARQKAYLLRDPISFASLLIAKIQHKQIAEALRKGDFATLGRLEWEYTDNRSKVHADAVPDETRSLFNWLLGKGNLTIEGREIASKFEKPLILGGELAGSMGTGSAASLIASDFGLEIINGQNTRVEAALALAIEKSSYFKQAYLRYLKISDKGPESGISDLPETPALASPVSAAPANTSTKMNTRNPLVSPDISQDIQAKLSMTALVEDVQASTVEMSTHLSIQFKDANALSGFVVVMKEGLPESVAGKDGVLGSVLQHEATLMRQQISKLFAGSDRGLVRVTKDNFSSEVSRLIGQDLKVIVLDDGELIQSTSLESINGVKPGVNCCVVTAEKVKPEEGTVPFVNINAMAMMGVAILSEDAPLFKLAYKTFTGKEYFLKGVIDFVNKAFWSIIRALPRSIPVSEAIDIEDSIQKVFAVAA